MIVVPRSTFLHAWVTPYSVRIAMGHMKWRGHWYAAAARGPQALGVAD